MSDWEQALRNIADGERWELPALGQAKMSLGRFGIFVGG